MTKLVQIYRRTARAVQKQLEIHRNGKKCLKKSTVDYKIQNADKNAYGFTLEKPMMPKDVRNCWRTAKTVRKQAKIHINDQNCLEKYPVDYEICLKVNKNNHRQSDSLVLVWTVRFTSERPVIPKDVWNYWRSTRAVQKQSEIPKNFKNRLEKSPVD